MGQPEILRLKSGVATQEHDDPDGDAWAPLESDTTLYDHYWFWSAEHDESHAKARISLVDCYVKSSGRGGMFLLDSSPNTDGLIPAADVRAYQALGKAIKKRFGHPWAGGKKGGKSGGIDFGRVISVNCSDLWEDYAYGHRIREYVVEGWVGTLGTAGERNGGRTAQNRFFSGGFPVPPAAAGHESVGTPLIRRFAAHYDGQEPAPNSLTFRRPATASSEWNPQYAAADLVDGNAGTRWCAARGDKDAWVEIDLGRRRHLGGASASEFGSDIESFVSRCAARRRNGARCWRAIKSARMGQRFRRR